jgi:hypothetical protein
MTGGGKTGGTHPQRSNRVGKVTSRRRTGLRSRLCRRQATGRKLPRRVESQVTRIPRYQCAGEFHNGQLRPGAFDREARTPLVALSLVTMCLQQAAAALPNLNVGLILVAVGVEQVRNRAWYLPHSPRLISAPIPNSHSLLMIVHTGACCSVCCARYNHRRSPRLHRCPPALVVSHWLLDYWITHLVQTCPYYPGWCELRSSACGTLSPANDHPYETVMFCCRACGIYARISPTPRHDWTQMRCPRSRVSCCGQPAAGKSARRPRASQRSCCHEGNGGRGSHISSLGMVARIATPECRSQLDVDFGRATQWIGPSLTPGSLLFPPLRCAVSSSHAATGGDVLRTTESLVTVTVAASAPTVNVTAGHVPVEAGDEPPLTFGLNPRRRDHRRRRCQRSPAPSPLASRPSSSVAVRVVQPSIVPARLDMITQPVRSENRTVLAAVKRMIVVAVVYFLP